ncbi:hypothetical protein HDU97_006133 [Phlyctochytrium planicorne]|nr:hypothetical protein HDU97_006133 [Phlyctochytrium planicorne]
MLDKELFSLSKQILDRLSSYGHTLAIAESLTGGLVAARITDVPGASQILKGGIVAYTNAVKHSILSVPLEVLDSVGPVSEECAFHMARGAARVCQADW